jgi:hypothetical protein
MARTGGAVDAQVSVYPATQGERLLIWQRRVPFGWVIPIVVLIILSFPPLFGHEIVGVLIGLVREEHRISEKF